MGVQPIAAVGHEEKEEDGQYEMLLQLKKRQEESRASLTEMIQDAKEKADAQREKFNLAKTTPRYGDAPLEAYARLNRAKTQAQVSSAAGYARRRIVQLESAARSDPDHAPQIRAAVGQLKKAVVRAGRKKMELNREQLARARQKRMARENRRREEQRIRQELRRSQSMRSIRESGYFQEVDIANRQADQLTATRMELKAQAEQLGTAAQKSIDAAMQGYSVGTQLAAADLNAPIAAPQVNVQA